MDKTRVFDKVIPQGYADQIEQDLMHRQFPWYYIDDVTSRSYGNNSGFSHVAYDLGVQPSEWYPFLKPLVYAIEEAAGHKISQLLRIRVGMLLKTDEPEYDYNTPHLDFLMPHYTACYYVNDSDGDTILFNQGRTDVPTHELSEKTVLEFVKSTDFTIEDRCTPKKGQVCLFDGMRFHASSKPKNTSRRIVITINYRVGDIHAP